MERADGPKRPSASQSDPSGIVVVAAWVLAQDLGGIPIMYADGERARAIKWKKETLLFHFHVMSFRAVIAIVACPSYGSIWALTFLLAPVPSASGAIECGNPGTKIRVDNFGGTRSLRPNPDTVQGANKHYGSYIFFHGSIGFLVFSSFVIG